MRSAVYQKIFFLRFSFGRVVVPSSKIAVILTRSSEKLPYRFSGKRDPSVHTHTKILLLYCMDKNLPNEEINCDIFSLASLSPSSESWGCKSCWAPSSKWSLARNKKNIKKFHLSCCYDFLIGTQWTKLNLFWKKNM